MSENEWKIKSIMRNPIRNFIKYFFQIFILYSTSFLHKILKNLSKTSNSFLSKLFIFFSFCFCINYYLIISTLKWDKKNNKQNFLKLKLVWIVFNLIYIFLPFLMLLLHLYNQDFLIFPGFCVPTFSLFHLSLFH